MDVVLSLFPVVLFLVFLFLFDSFKLVVLKYLLIAVVWGIASAGIAYLFNTKVSYLISFEVLSQYIAPGVEELLKILLILLLLKQKKIGFMIDASIYGFAIGAGFALTENIVYLQNTSDPNLLIWIVRGFGTSIMHGGCTALFAMILISARTRSRKIGAYFPLALVVAYFIHALFNHFYISPVVQTLGIIVLLPVVFTVMFRYNENQLQNWLEIEFSSEIELLKTINKGQFSTTKSGQYLASLKSKFSNEILVDMYCYIELYMELSVKAKRNLMLKENGFPPIIEPDISDKLKELMQLRKQIGKLGELTLSPLIRMNYRDLWKLSTLK